MPTHIKINGPTLKSPYWWWCISPKKILKSDNQIQWVISNDKGSVWKTHFRILAYLFSPFGCLISNPHNSCSYNTVWIFEFREQKPEVGGDEFFYFSFSIFSILVNINDLHTVFYTYISSITHVVKYFLTSLSNTLEIQITLSAYFKKSKII